MGGGAAGGGAGDMVRGAGEALCIGSDMMPDGSGAFGCTIASGATRSTVPVAGTGAGGTTPDPPVTLCTSAEAEVADGWTGGCGRAGGGVAVCFVLSAFAGTGSAAARFAFSATNPNFGAGTTLSRPSSVLPASADFTTGTACPDAGAGRGVATECGSPDMEITLTRGFGRGSAPGDPAGAATDDCSGD